MVQDVVHPQYYHMFFKEQPKVGWKQTFDPFAQYLSLAPLRLIAALHLPKEKQKPVGRQSMRV